MTQAELGELCNIQSGGTPSRSNPEFYGGSIPWAKISDIEAAGGTITETEETITPEGLQAIRGRSFPAGTLLFAIYGSIGKMAFAGKEMSTNQAILGIQNCASDRLCERYLFRYLEARKDDLLRDGSGIAQKNLSAKYVRELKIPLPPLGEQKRIAGILDQADALRRLRTRALDKLDTLGLAIFLEMFVNNASPNWKAVKVDDVIVNSRTGPFGSQLLVSEFVDEGIPVLGIDNVVQNNLNP